MMLFRIKPLIITMLFSFNLFSQTDDSTAIVLQASYVSDFGRNFSGGVNQDNFYMGLMNISLDLPLFKNGEFYLQVQNTHGSTPSGNSVGDLQTFSNIENGDFTYLYAAWYKHSFGNFSSTFGIHDLNSEFDMTDFGGKYINSSFGIQPNLSWNLPVSIFPKNALGLVLDYQTEKIRIFTAFYDGNPGNLDDDPYNLKQDIDFKNQGFLNITEIQYKNYSSDRLKATYKLGYAYHSGQYLNYSDSSFKKGNIGLYFIADKYLNEIFGMFSQLGWSPSKFNLNPYYASLGLNISGIGKQKAHEAGLAVTYVKISDEYCHLYSLKSSAFESAIEIFFKIQLIENITIMPDIQYLLNPDANNQNKNVFLGLLRVNIGLEENKFRNMKNP